MFREKNEELRKELQKQGTSESGVSQSQNVGFKEMYRSLQKAKQILLALMELLGIHDESGGEGGIIGSILSKRQRTQ